MSVPEGDMPSVHAETVVYYHQETRLCKKMRVAHIRMASLLGHHHLHELLVIDLAISIDVRFADHFVNLVVSQLLA